jgi:hypothetical protein
LYQASFETQQLSIEIALLKVRLQPHNLDRSVAARQLNQPSAAADPSIHLSMPVLVIDVQSVEL